MVNALHTLKSLLHGSLVTHVTFDKLSFGGNVLRLAPEMHGFL
jgi:hypothetical protein